MRTTRNTSFYCLLVLCSLVLFGCGNGQETEVKVDENKPISEVKAEAEKMSTEELRVIALKYKEAVTAKSEEMNEITSNLPAAMADGNLNDKLSELKPKIEGIRNSMTALKARYDVYYQKLKEKGGDVSGLEP